MKITPIRREKASRTSLDKKRERGKARFSGGDASFRASLKNVDRFLTVIWKIKILWMTRQHTRLCSQYNVTYKRSKIRGLWHTFGCSTDDETERALSRVMSASAYAQNASRTWHESTRMWRVGGLFVGLRIPTTDRWRGARESRQRESTRWSETKRERDIHVCMYLERREARGAIDEATNEVRVPFDRKRERDGERESERKRHLGCHRERPLFHEMQPRKV